MRNHLGDLTIITHPGEIHSPVCADCESLYAKALLNETLQLQRTRLLVLFADFKGCKILGRLYQAEILKKTEGNPNGLVQNGSFKGYWAHQVNSTQWLLARPNQDGMLGPTGKPSGVSNLGLWLQGIRCIQTEDPHRWFDRWEYRLPLH